MQFEAFNRGIMVGMMRIHPKLEFTTCWQVTMGKPTRPLMVASLKYQNPRG